MTSGQEPLSDFPRTEVLEQVNLTNEKLDEKVNKYVNILNDQFTRMGEDAFSCRDKMTLVNAVVIDMKRLGVSSGSKMGTGKNKF